MYEGTIKEYNRLMLEKRIVENELALLKLELKKIEISNEMSGEPVNLKKEIMRIKRRNKREKSAQKSSARFKQRSFIKKFSIADILTLKTSLWIYTCEFYATTFTELFIKKD